jgi:hypothetical protein
MRAIRSARVIDVAATMLGLVLGAGVVSAQPDINHDCRSDFHDSLQFMEDYAAGRPAADLNLDGVVNQADFSSFADSPARTTYRIYWMVSSTLVANSYMDTQTDLSGLPISRHCVIYYEQEFPKVPVIEGADHTLIERGMHLMLRGSDGSYTNWRANLEAWMTEHAATTPAVVLRKVPSGFNGLVCLDFEAVLPLREQVRDMAGDTLQLARWDGAVAAINTPTFDADFVQMAGFTPPEGVTGWQGLSASQQEDLSSKAFEVVGERFFLTTLRETKRTLPNAKVGYYGFPTAWWPFYNDERRVLNDRLHNLFAECDIFMPSVYQLNWTGTDRNASPCPENFNTPAQNSVFFASLFTELHRVREQYGHPDQTIIPLAWWRYKAQAGGCSPDVDNARRVNDINLRHQLELPWWFGADGVAIWGYYGRPGPEYPYNWIDDPASVSLEIRTRWGPHIQRLACPK